MPAPEQAGSTWADFLRSQADALLACDFLALVLTTVGCLLPFGLTASAIGWMIAQGASLAIGAVVVASSFGLQKTAPCGPSGRRRSDDHRIGHQPCRRDLFGNAVITEPGEHVGLGG
jgi:hypothetical protein